MAENAPVALGLIGRYGFSYVKEYTMRVNSFMSNLLDKVGLLLADFKLEFGYDNDNHLVFCDEFSFDTCRLRTKAGDLVDKTALFTEDDCGGHSESLKAMHDALDSLKYRVQATRAEIEYLEKGGLINDRYNK